VLPIAVDDDAAKDVVAGFLDAIGYDAYAVGPLSEGWRYQRDTPAYVQPYAVPRTSYTDWSGRQLTVQMLRRC
jgi:8-hydroxy-5-deazaflavin:NADPH oxidoreductase